MLSNHRGHRKTAKGIDWSDAVDRSGGLCEHAKTLAPSNMQVQAICFRIAETVLSAFLLTPYPSTSFRAMNASA
jgi:hypothetical protein